MQPPTSETVARFQAQHSPTQLLDIIRVVSRTADPDQPEKVTQRAWDDARTDAGHPDAPRAHSITQRLQVPWSRLLVIANGNPDDALRALRQTASDKGRKDLALHAVATAMRQAATRLSAGTLNRGDYQRARQQILAGTRKPPARRVAERAMPTLTSIETVLAQNQMSWDDGLNMAGLQPPPAAGSVAGLDEEAATRAFVADIGKLPANGTQIRKWAASRGVSLQHHLVSARLKDAANLIQAETDEPIQVAGRGEHHTASTDGAGADAPARRVREWAKPQVIAGMAKAITLLGPGQQLTQRSIKEVARDHPGQGIPSWSVVHRCRTRHHREETWA